MTSWRLWQRWTIVATVLLLFVTFRAGVSAAPPEQATSRHFPQTGQTVAGDFLAFFDAHGGVAIFGYPITGEQLERGNMVQYFQRARFEWHPTNPPAYRVQMGLVGQEIHGMATARVQPLPPTATVRMRYFNETGHNVTNVFLDFWNANGGLDLFGYPLGEAFNRDGVTYQWFQRARMEYRGSGVELGLIGLELRAGSSNAPIAPVPNAPLPTDTVRRRQFPGTGQTVQGAFLNYWENRGGAVRFGLPISGEFSENRKTVQYFEFARFEYAPANPAGSQVQLGLIGQEIHGLEPRVDYFAPPWNSNYRYFNETGHMVSNAFLRWYDDNGGLELFGYPISEATVEGNATVQWFQRRKLTFVNNVVREEPLGRARFNPDNEGRFEPQQIFLLFVTDNPTIGTKLGKGLEDAKNPTVAYQPFEGGQMIWRGDTNQIFVFYSDTSWQVYDNPWRPGDAVSASITAPVDRYEPVLGFGEVWRSIGGVGSRLGWATETQRDGTGTAQRFQFGTMLYNPVNDSLYVMYEGQGWKAYANLYPGFVPSQPD